MSLEINNAENYEEHLTVGSPGDLFPTVVVSDIAKDIMRELDKLGIKHKKHYKDTVPLYNGEPNESVTLDGIELLTNRKHIIAYIGNIGMSNISIRKAEMDNESTMNKGEFLVVTIYNQRNQMSLLELMFALEDGFL